MANIEEKVENLIKSDVENLGYDLFDVVYEKDGKDFYLRIYIDSPNGITLNDCERVNNAITDKIDEADYIKEMYFLEVSSCGLERILRKENQMKKYLNQEVLVKLFKPFNGSKSYIGLLHAINPSFITIKSENRNIEIERKNISQIKTIYHWENQERNDEKNENNG